MISLSERRQQRIARDVQEQAEYVVGVVQKKIEAGEESPFRAYAYVRGLTPEDTARSVGQSVIGQLGEEFTFDADIDERQSKIVRAGAIISVIPSDVLSHPQ